MCHLHMLIWSPAIIIKSPYLLLSQNKCKTLFPLSLQLNLYKTATQNQGIGDILR